MALMEKYTYDGKFQGNILIMGRTECGKTTFMQKVVLNNFFGKIERAEWVSYIPLTSKREIQSNFSCDVKFYYPRSVGELED